MVTSVHWLPNTETAMAKMPRGDEFTLNGLSDPSCLIHHRSVSCEGRTWKGFPVRQHLAERWMN